MTEQIPDRSGRGEGRDSRGGLPQNLAGLLTVGVSVVAVLVSGAQVWSAHIISQGEQDLEELRHDQEMASQRAQDSAQWRLGPRTQLAR